MTSYNYFVLSDSTSGSSFNFGVLEGSYERHREKAETIRKTINGGLDVSRGQVYETHTYTVRVRHTETRIGWGTLDDLKYFFNLNNALGSPSDVITLTDHWGVTHTCYMVGSFDESLLGCSIEGAEAIWNVQVRFLFIPEALT